MWGGRNKTAFIFRTDANKKIFRLLGRKEAGQRSEGGGQGAATEYNREGVGWGPLGGSPGRVT